MNTFSKLSLKYKISGLVFLCNTVLISASFWGLQGVVVAEGALSGYHWTFAIVAVLTTAFSVFAGFEISSSVESMISELAKNTSNLDDVATRIASGATELSSAATEQAAALQESVATIDQIGAMVHKNSEAAMKSKDLSIDSKNSAEMGRQTVDSMMVAINEIEANNTDLSNQMHTSNMQLAEITKLIHEISSKTQVINDIVFQTKLLSFNAAVEAARAGEYGYGFSVVAEEIGKLAQRSGGAAKEITNMLQESVGRVEFIIADTKNKVDKIMLVSKEKINFGSEKAKHCKEALDEIIISVKSVDSLVLEITEASKEQSLGVGQVSHAINQLESVTNQNSAVAQASSTAGEQLRRQSTTIHSIVKNLNNYISGSSEVKKTEFAASSVTRKTSQKENKQHDVKKPVAVKKPMASENKKSGDKKVLQFNKKPAAVDPAAGEMLEFKKAAGYEGKLPSADDPGFDE